MAKDINQQLKPWTDFYYGLTGKERYKAVRAAMRREGNRVRKVAIADLHSCGLRVGPAADKNIRIWVFMKACGFIITVAPKRGMKEAVMYLTARGLKKPVLMWSNMGTVERKTFRGTRLGHSTGIMPATHFMDRADRLAPGLVKPRVLQDLQQGLTKIARKSGVL